jgi:hypothetical protein
LSEARADEHHVGARGAGDHRGDHEERRAGQQDAAAAQEVGGAAAEQHEAAIGQQVPAEHPLQVLHGEAEVAADRRQRDVDDRRIDEIEERDRAQQSKDLLAAPGRQDGGC